MCLEVVFLWRAHARALTVARWLWGAFIVVLVFGALVNPFFWHDLQLSGQWWLLPISFSICVLGAWCWHTLRSHSPAPLYQRRT